MLVIKLYNKNIDILLINKIKRTNDHDIQK